MPEIQSEFGLEYGIQELAVTNLVEILTVRSLTGFMHFMSCSTQFLRSENKFLTCFCSQVI